MSILVRFRLNAPTFNGPSPEEILSAIAAQGRSNGNEPPEFLVWGDGACPDSTLVEYLRGGNFVTALSRVRRAIAAAGVERYCTGGDLHLPEEPVK